LILSFLSFFCGCSIFCVLPIIFAFMAKSANDSGNYADAESKIGTAKIFCIIGYALTVVYILINIVAAAA
jgi:hypothetical protein